MEGKEQWIAQVMELVDKYGCAVESTVTGDPRNHPLYSDENSAYQAIRTKLNEVVSCGNAPERKSLTDEQVAGLIHAKHFRKDCEQLSVQSTKTNLSWYRVGLRDGERAHNIGVEQ